MKQFNKHLFLQVAFFFNIIPMMASENLLEKENAIPIDNTWILLIAGIFLGIYKIYKNEKVKEAITISR